MATIYRFIVEQQEGGGGSGRKSDSTSKKNAKDKTFTLMGSMGVEHNRKLRAINPVLNKATGGYWEKGMRLGRAALGLVKFKRNASGGISGVGFSFTAIAIIISFLLQTSMKHHQKLLQQSERENKQNYRKMETGESSVHSAFTVSTNVWSGKRTYNENK